VAEVTIRELRNHGGDVVERAAGGERVIITRSGKPVAELRPLTAAPRTAESLLHGWRRLPRLNAAALRADLDELLDSSL
jgi:prevent-host-death family protein